MLLKPLERYSGSRLRQKVSSPKLILLNNGLVNAFSQRKLKETQKDKTLWGRLVENAVGASLVNNNAGKGIEVFYTAAPGGGDIPLEELMTLPAEEIFSEAEKRRDR